MRIILAVLTGLMLSSCNETVLDVGNIINKTPKEVRNLLGEPDTAYTQLIVTKSIFTEIYNHHDFEVEVMYPEGLSTDIVVLNGAPGLPFEASTITDFGLKEIPPTDFLENGYIKWKNYPGYTTINFFATDLDSAGKVEQFRLFFKSNGNGN